MGVKPPAPEAQTKDLGPGQYFKTEEATGGVTIPKSGRGAFYDASDNGLGPGQYHYETSTLNKNGVSFKGKVAGLEAG